MSGFDAVVLGGGPAGCATALYAARAGLRVALLERGSFPRAKTCGEGLMPAGAAVLRELGLWEDLAALGTPFRGVRYTSESGRRAEGRFPGGGTGLGVPREALDAALWRAAARTPGVTAIERSADPGVYPAALLAVCDGARSRAAEGLGARRPAPERRRYGLSARFCGLEPGEFVRVFIAAGAELYVTPLPAGQALVAALVEERALERPPEAAYERLVRSCSPLREALGRARRCTPVRLFGPLGRQADRVHGPGWLLAGDAAGALDPIIGDGMAAALQTGRLAGRALAAAAAGDRAALARYAAERRRLLRARSWLARLALAAAGRPATAEAVIGVLAAWPGLFQAALSLF